MPIPDYQTLMLPLLKEISDGKEHYIRDTVDHLAQVFGLTEDEQKARLASCNSEVFYNRVTWARMYLLKAGLLRATRRGYFSITKSGLEGLARNPSKIDNAFLRSYPGFMEFKRVQPRQAGSSNASRTSSVELETKTPEEALEYGYQQLRQTLQQQLLEQVKEGSSSFFEKLVVELLVKMGYGGSLKDAGEVVGKAGDDGIDGVIKEDRLGLDAIYIQAKRWGDAQIGRPELQKFVGALRGQRANKGVFITTSKFSRDAQEYVSRVDSKVVLIDGDQLTGLMIDFGVGVTTTASYDVKRVDSDYFTEE